MAHATSALKLIVFFFNDTATTEIYTLSLHDALPISLSGLNRLEASVAYAHPDVLVSTDWVVGRRADPAVRLIEVDVDTTDRKSTRLNSSHSQISYAVFCLKKKNQQLHLT